MLAFRIAHAGALCLWLAVGASAAGAGCRRLRPTPTLTHAGCEKACRRLVTACEGSGDATWVQAGERCSAGCRRGAEHARAAGCEALHGAYLECVARAAVACSEESRRATAGMDGTLVGPSCASEFERLSRCRAACNEASVVYTRSASLNVRGALHQVHAEATGLGCDPGEPEKPRRAPAGAACEHYSTCSYVRCACPGRRIGFLARACLDARCADREQACEWVPRVLEQYGCGAGPPE